MKMPPPQVLGTRWKEIENVARDVHRKMWLRRDELLGGSLRDEVELLSPGIALEMLGYEVESSDFLGEFDTEGVRTEVAGLIDPTEKIVRISRRFPTHVQMFTAAHELGHAVLHPRAVTQHRDRPLGGSDAQRDPLEREADWFATCFLMPARLVRARFTQAFKTARFEVNDDSAFALCNTSVERLLARMKDPRDLSRQLADTNTYGGRSIEPLSSTFGVSTLAMAIRIEQLGLLAPLRRQPKPPAYLLAH